MRAFLPFDEAYSKVFGGLVFSLDFSEEFILALVAKEGQDGFEVILREVAAPVHDCIGLLQKERGALLASRRVEVVTLPIQPHVDLRLVEWSSS